MAKIRVWNANGEPEDVEVEEPGEGPMVWDDQGRPVPAPETVQAPTEDEN